MIRNNNNEWLLCSWEERRKLYLCSWQENRYHTRRS